MEELQDALDEEVTGYTPMLKLCKPTDNKGNYFGGR
jgi:hypothetical protein